ncbi:MAG: helix-turn-helix transcriptional regulator [Synechococcales cyanobacterium T60_A2020_003]|nr:helix-turn-helix transcriptional regulator [Synechococcales cyanobacterium T60_A2020_003]
MSLSDSVPFEVLQQVAEYFDVLAEPMRLRILNLLRGGEKCVQELVDATATSQANVSKHLKVMLQVGILTRRTEGTSAYYSVADDLSFELCTLVCDRLASRIEEQAQHFRAFSFSVKAPHSAEGECRDESGAVASPPCSYAKQSRGGGEGRRANRQPGIIG